jgi:hypothetical protein
VPDNAVDGGEYGHVGGDQGEPGQFPDKFSAWRVIGLIRGEQVFGALVQTSSPEGAGTRRGLNF